MGTGKQAQGRTPEVGTRRKRTGMAQRQKGLPYGLPVQGVLDRQAVQACDTACPVLHRKSCLVFSVPGLHGQDRSLHGTGLPAGCGRPAEAPERGFGERVWRERTEDTGAAGRPAGFPSPSVPASRLFLSRAQAHRTHPLAAGPALRASPYPDGSEAFFMTFLVLFPCRKTADAQGPLMGSFLSERAPDTSPERNPRSLRSREGPCACVGSMGWLSS